MASWQAGRLIAAGVLTLASAWPSALFAGQVGPNSRAEATKIVAEMRRIVTPQGFERLERVHIGGIDQWISVAASIVVTRYPLHSRRTRVPCDAEKLVLPARMGRVIHDRSVGSARSRQDLSCQ